MPDRRRAQWFAFDSYFFGGKLGAGLRRRFGAIGIVVFVAFVAACKRSPIQGQITYHNETDGLAILALPGLQLVNEKGEEWTLEELWTYLGQQKVTSRRRHGDLTDVTSTQWAKWQEHFGRQVEAEQKAKSRARNTPPKLRQPSDDEQPLGGTDSDSDNDQPPPPPDDDSRRLSLVSPDDADGVDADDLERLSRVWHSVLADHGCKTSLAKATAVVRTALVVADARVVDERIGIIGQGDTTISSPQYLAGAVSRFMSAHHHQDPAS